MIAAEENTLPSNVAAKTNANYCSLLCVVFLSLRLLLNSTSAQFVVFGVTKQGGSGITFVRKWV
jgi:hypothetical protein